MLAIENVHDLEIALAASEQGSFSGAARKLGITQPAVSQAVARLERQSNSTLFDRQQSGHAGFLTDAGAVLLSHASTAIDELSGALDELGELRGSRPIVVGLPAAFARHYFPQGLDVLTKLPCDVPIEIVLYDSERLREELRLHRVDVGMIASSDLGISLPHTTFARVASYPLMLAVREADLPAHAHLSIKALAESRVPIITFSGDRFLRSSLSEQLSRSGNQLNVVAETDQSAMLCQLVAAGMGVGLSSNLVLEDAPHGIRLTEPTDAGLPQLNVFVFEDAARARGPERNALWALRRQLFDAVRADRE